MGRAHREEGMKFPLGQVVATPGAFAALEASGDSLFTYLARHQSGDWGDLTPTIATKTNTRWPMASESCRPTG